MRERARGGGAPLYVLWALLLICAWLALEVELRYADLERGVPVSLLGYALPSAALTSPWTLAACQVAFFAAGGLWALRRALPWSAWATALSFVAIGSLYWESLPWFRHKYVVPAQLLCAHALWSHARLRRGAPPVTPRWAKTLYIYLIGQFYTLAAWSKLLAVGPRWGDGLSLQLWLQWLGDDDAFLTRLLLSDRRYAACAQSGVLLIELAGVLMVGSPRLRRVIGSALIGVHLAIDITLHIDFSSQIALLGLFVWTPWERAADDAPVDGRARGAEHDTQPPRSVDRVAPQESLTTQ